MSLLPQSIENLIEEFSKLPGIGPKTAHRLVFYLLSLSNEGVKKFGESVLELKQNLKLCERCFNFTENHLCDICQDPRRDQSKIAVVEESLDIIALEKASFDGVYHVLGGVISPIDGVGPEQLRVKELLDGIKNNAQNLNEIILALNPSLEGEATSLFLQKEIEKLSKVKITRLARGLPVGSDLEYADEITLTRALEGRKEY